MVKVKGIGHLMRPACDSCFGTYDLVCSLFYSFMEQYESNYIRKILVLKMACLFIVIIKY